ncbi:YHYH protein [Jannaschia marina]|uniref:YHYH protein n=1 Tax=Jannaschia marina TaxID=2741674 RepID=UPI0015CA18D1|nr:YHYH protein [Jannaschia marina]
MKPELKALAFSVLLVSTPGSAHENDVTWDLRGDMICAESNGVPDHAMGRFPNRANPNTFRLQRLTFCFPETPQMAGTVTTGLMTVGVSLTGVPFRPYTAGYYDPDGRRQLGPDPSSGWRQQAMHDPRSLGMDAENGHVDRAGLYHYHGVSPSLEAQAEGGLLGYAPDGFEIRYSPATATSSYVLKAGSRPTPPHGAHDGSYEEDFEYSAGSGTLDECNGMLVDGTYTYFATDAYPYLPRCFKGVVNPDFMTRG